MTYFNSLPTRHNLLFAAAVITLSLIPPARANDGEIEPAPQLIAFTFDVALDGTRARITEPAASGLGPVRGAKFESEGRIFIAGTIPAKGEDFDPNSTAGQLGSVVSNGTYLVDGTEFASTPEALVSDQQLIFNNGERVVFTHGTEGNDLSFRVVTKGEGAFARYLGEQRQRFLGFNKTGGANLRVTLILNRVLAPAVQ